MIQTAEMTIRTGDRREEKTMHLFDEDAAEEQALCGTDTSATERRGMRGYLQDRLDDRWVGTVCEECKALAAHFAMNISRDLEAYEKEDEAEDYRGLAGRLAGETGSYRGPDWEGGRSSMCGPFFAFEGRAPGFGPFPYRPYSSMLQPEPKTWPS